MIKRREALVAGLFGTGLLGLRAVATGLPAWFIANPRTATAQDLSCAIDAIDKAQFLIVSANFNGDPINCNCPGTYEDPAAIHPQQETMAPAAVQLGSASYQAAMPWAATDNGGKLAAATLSRINFFHYRTGSVVHGDQAKVLRMMGGTNKAEMLPSLYAKHLAGCLGTVQADPISIGAGRNAAELLTFEGRPAANVSPTSLKAMLGSATSGGGMMGGGFGMRPGGANALRSLRQLRDQTLDQLNALAKESSTPIQSQFLDALANSQLRVRELTESLSSTLSGISGNDAAGQARAAGALFLAKVTPAVTIRLAFGGDNHSDADLQNEADQHVTGIESIQTVLDVLAELGLSDKVTFATLNVFGRNLNGSKVEGRSGRDHYANHAVSVLIGKNVAPGVTGGIALGTGSGFGGGASQLAAAHIDSTTGLPSPDGDIPSSETYGALARTLGVALGIPASALDPDFNSNAGGKVVSTALNGVSG
jgi:hypothetical protein